MKNNENPNSNEIISFQLREYYSGVVDGMCRDITFLQNALQESTVYWHGIVSRQGKEIDRLENKVEALQETYQEARIIIDALLRVPLETGGKRPLDVPHDDAVKRALEFLKEE